ncbi:hypothetical protein DKX38_003697 [Salix brachista]|uniref:MLO-like protein n=1 Tax=Salix brachista TaxID=2182728 RepID=A0A5N5NAM3_9ROSI|nr:hypothetical protein DKX38_003697 [Salix brachista]
MLPCRQTIIKTTKSIQERMLAAESDSDYCGSRGMTSLISESGIGQLNIFIFVMAIMQIVYTVLTMALGRAKAHLPNSSSFNFQRYIQRSLDYDFKEVVGIRPWMWFVVVIFMLVDIHEINGVVLQIVLLLGTKLGVVVAEMALQIQDQSSVIKGAPLVRPNDSLFWFSHPKHVLTLIHFTLFMLQYGIHSCYHESVEIIVVRVVLAVTVQIMCSYITLPLYALVTQMGSQFKGAILDEQTVNAIKQWHSGVRKKMKKKTQDFSLSNHQSYSSPISTSNRTMDSPSDNNHHHSRNGSQDHIPSLSRNPTFSDITSFHGQIEITEDGAQDFSQHLVPSSVIEIAEVPDLTKK